MGVWEKQGYSASHVRKFPSKLDSVGEEVWQVRTEKETVTVTAERVEEELQERETAAAAKKVTKRTPAVTAGPELHVLLEKPEASSKGGKGAAAGYKSEIAALKAAEKEAKAVARRNGQLNQTSVAALAKLQPRCKVLETLSTKLASKPEAAGGGHPHQRSLAQDAELVQRTQAHGAASRERACGCLRASLRHCAAQVHPSGKCCPGPGCSAVPAQSKGQAKSAAKPDGSETAPAEAETAAEPPKKRRRTKTAEKTG